MLHLIRTPFIFILIAAVLLPSSLAGFTDTTSWDIYTPADHGVGTNAKGFGGEAAYDGRYLYFPPFSNDNGPQGEVLRYDTVTNFSSNVSWSTFDATTVDGAATTYAKAIFDGRYVYFTPDRNSNNSSSTVLRFDTLGDFQNASSWTTFDPFTSGVIGHNASYDGVTFDGRYLYFSPWYYGTGHSHNGDFLRYDTAAPFTNAGSWTNFDAESAGVGSNLHGFIDAVYDGNRYVYYMTGDNIPATPGRIVRYDTTGIYTNASSWQVFAPHDSGVSAIGDSYTGAVYDGRYMYFIPANYDTSSYFGEFLRYDSNGSFTNTASWSTFNPSLTLGAAYEGYYSGVSDGRYLYFAPYYKDGHIPHGDMLRFDTFNSFNDINSWSGYSPENAGIGTNLSGYTGVTKAGNYLYFVPYYSTGGYSGTILRYHNSPTGTGNISTSAIVSDALILSLDQSTIALHGDPSTNNGHDSSQYTVLTVSSNALSGYGLYGSLDDGTGHARLSNGAAYIPSGLGLNTFSFEAFNSAYSAIHTVVTDSTFSNTMNILTSHSSTIGLPNPTNTQDHTIYYDLNVDYTTPAGSYSGVITYTAIGSF